MIHHKVIGVQSWQSWKKSCKEQKTLFQTKRPTTVISIARSLEKYVYMLWFFNLFLQLRCTDVMICMILIEVIQKVTS